jgi:DNA (cytosine-5)-methyltransferase 1
MKSSNPHSGCREVTSSKTLDASGPDPSKNQGGIVILQPIVLDNHPQDSRVTIREDGLSPTLTEKMGTGGGNVPLILEPMGIQQNADGEVRMYPVSSTLNTNGNASGRNAPLVLTQSTSQPIPINDKATRCEGGGSTRNGDGSGNGLGVGKPGDPAPTLTAADRHAVAYGIDRSFFGGLSVAEETSATITSGRDHKTVVQHIGMVYIARRFTPLECGRLQGFPDWWATGLGVDSPPAGMVDRWVQIFETYWEAVTKSNGTKSPKTRNQVIKWLKDPASDSALYKMWGNGIALPCAMFVMGGIASRNRKE